MPMPGNENELVPCDGPVVVGDKYARSISAPSSSSSQCNNISSPSSSTSAAPYLGEAAVYGQLVILGYNGTLPSGERRRRKSKFTLTRRPVANGLKKARSTLVNLKTPNVVEVPAVADRGVHSISYTLNRNQAVVVEYVHDDKTDLFQVS
jgi:pellino protein